jgi:hypothetical protein
MADFELTLGDFTFQGTEIPEEIAIGGKHRNAPKELIGGIRVVDMLGRSDDDLSWSGWLRGSNAGSRRAYLDAYRVAGAPLTLSWADLRYQVVVIGFTAIFRRTYEYRYTITFKVIADLTLVSGTSTAPSIDDAINGDLGTATTLSSSIGDPTLSSIMSTVSSAVSSVSTFVNAAKSTVNSVLQPIQSAVNQVQTLTAGVEATIASAQGFAGVIAGGAGGMASIFSAQISAVQNLTSLNQLSGVLGRMSQNLNAVGDSATQVAVAGANLFSLAAGAYGDATEWTTIAQANDLSDPFVSGPETLTIPPVPSDTDGVLNA